MNKDVRLMLKIYKTENVDWMGYKISKKDVITRHHIIKSVYGGINDISNYALLIEESHQYLHQLENKNTTIYNELNNLFKELNDRMMPPSKEYYMQVKSILKRVKKK